MPLRVLVDIVQQRDLALQLVSDLDTQLMLPTYRLTQVIQLLVLLPYYLGVVGMDLLVGEGLFVEGRGGRGVAIRVKERRAVGVVVAVVIGSAIGEADRFGWRMLRSWVF